mmetsp:Transcript_16085/g.31480  ORF Transcript_16085/g.31480 Transcript_16085/m.31480 type:complete len:285 (-) Transcript_16085:386-1240(-)
MVAKTAINPDILAATHCHFLRNLLHTARLLVTHGSRLQWVCGNIAWPFWHQALEKIRINVHYMLEGENIVRGQPRHCVTFTCSHGTTCKYHPWQILRPRALRNTTYHLVLPELALLSVVRVPRKVKICSDICVLTIDGPVLLRIVFLVQASAQFRLGYKILMAVSKIGGNTKIVIRRHLPINLCDIARCHCPQESTVLHPLAEFGKADHVCTVSVDVCEQSPQFNVTQRKVQLILADAKKLLRQHSAALVVVELHKSFPEFMITKIRNIVKISVFIVTIICTST